MKKFAVAVAFLMTTSSPLIANAETGARPISRAHCYTHEILHPDGSTETHTACHTTADGTR